MTRPNPTFNDVDNGLATLELLCPTCLKDYLECLFEDIGAPDDNEEDEPTDLYICHGCDTMWDVLSLNMKMTWNEEGV